MSGIAWESVTRTTQDEKSFRVNLIKHLSQFVDYNQKNLPDIEVEDINEGWKFAHSYFERLDKMRVLFKSFERLVYETFSNFAIFFGVFFCCVFSNLGH